MSKLSVLCQLNGGCMGCCGHDFGSVAEMKEAIKKNTSEYLKINVGKEEDMVKFRDRAYTMDLRKGVCRNLIEKDGKIFCPLHPTLNDGKELRLGHCDIDYLCKTAREFEDWSEEKKQRFLKFVAGKKLDKIKYSILMDDGGLLEEFCN
jgi:hypothetical protein